MSLRTDLLYSFGAFLTFCQIKRNDAERRVRQMAQNNWRSIVKAFTPGKEVAVAADTEVPEEAIDLERLGRDSIARLIIGKFKGHGMERLVEAILKAQGYHLPQPGRSRQGRRHPRCPRPAREFALIDLRARNNEATLF